VSSVQLHAAIDSTHHIISMSLVIALF